MRRVVPTLASVSLGVALLAAGCDMADASAAGEGPLAGGDSGGPADTSEFGEETGEEPGEETGEEQDNGLGDCDAPSPYAGGWDIGCCQDEVVPGPWEAGAIEPGLVLPDWRFIDQYGEPVRVYDFCHEAVYFEYVAMWCTSCQAHAPEIANLYTDYSERGLMTLTYMSESESGGVASLPDVQAWADTYGQDGLVVFSETAEGVWFPFAMLAGAGSYSISLPGTMLVGPGMQIAKLGVPTLQDIETVVPWN